MPQGSAPPCEPSTPLHPLSGLKRSRAHPQGPRAGGSTRCGRTGHPDTQEEGARAECAIAGAGYPLQY